MNPHAVLVFAIVILVAAAVLAKPRHVPVDANGNLIDRRIDVGGKAQDRLPNG
jgi:hypothetical protein